MYKYVYTSDYEYYDESYVENLKDRISSLNLDNQQDLDMYVNDKTELDTYELLKQYDKGTWQYKLILEKASSYLSEINTYTYKINDCSCAAALLPYARESICPVYFPSITLYIFVFCPPDN